MGDGIFSIMIPLHSSYPFCLQDRRYRADMKATHPGLSKFAEGIVSERWYSKLKIQNFRDWLLNKFAADTEEEAAHTDVD